MIGTVVEIAERHAPKLGSRAPTPDALVHVNEGVATQAAANAMTRLAAGSERLS